MCNTPIKFMSMEKFIPSTIIMCCIAIKNHPLLSQAIELNGSYFPQKNLSLLEGKLYHSTWCTCWW